MSKQIIKRQNEYQKAKNLLTQTGGPLLQTPLLQTDWEDPSLLNPSSQAKVAVSPSSIMEPFRGVSRYPQGDTGRTRQLSHKGGVRFT